MSHTCVRAEVWPLQLVASVGNAGLQWPCAARGYAVAQTVLQHTPRPICELLPDTAAAHSRELRGQTRLKRATPTSAAGVCAGERGAGNGENAGSRLRAPAGRSVQARGNSWLQDISVFFSIFEDSA